MCSGGGFLFPTFNNKLNKQPFFLRLILYVVNKTMDYDNRKCML
jgi:hypothetical protein